MTTTVDRARPTPEEVLGVVREAVAIVCERPTSSIASDADFDELGIDSLGRVELAELVEQRLAPAAPALHIADDDLAAFRTVADAVDYLLGRL